MKNGLKTTGPFTFVAQRLILAFLALAPFSIFLRKRIPRDKDTWLKILVLSLIHVVNISSTNIGLVGEESGTGAILTYTQPLFVFCLAVPFLKEKVNAKKILGIVIGFLGVAFLYLGKDLSFATVYRSGFFLLFGAFVWAVMIVYYKKFLSHVDPILVNLVQFAIGAFILSILSFALGEFTLEMTGDYLLIVLYLAIGASAIASTIWIFLIKDEEATVVSASSFVVPMIALIFGWIFLQETIEIGSTLGFILILAGLYLVNKKELKTVS
jgi:drug/metabolite transporter (DMT)-like permease